MDIAEYRVGHHDNLKLSQVATNGHNGSQSNAEIEKNLAENIQKMEKLQSKLYASSQYALLIIFQGMDAAGKDGAIRHVMTGLNPLATHVTAFKQPSSEELSHDYLWRTHKHLPERGHIGIFNRSYYEELLVVRVHNLLPAQRIPPELVSENIWKQRYDQVKAYETYLAENGTVVIKFYLHISKAEQKNRLLQRIDDESKNWKFSQTDVKEREYWSQYQNYYQEAIAETSTKQAPWYVIPADKKWFARLLISEIIVKTMDDLKPAYPRMSDEQVKILQQYRELLAAD